MKRPKNLKPKLIFSRPNSPKPKPSKNWQKSQNRGVPGSFETDMSISGRDLFDNLTLFVNWLCLTISRAPFAQTILPAAWARSRWTPSTMSRRCRSWTKPLTSLASSGEHKFLTKFGVDPSCCEIKPKCSGMRKSTCTAWLPAAWFSPSWNSR